MKPINNPTPWVGNVFRAVNAALIVELHEDGTYTVLKNRVEAPGQFIAARLYPRPAEVER